MHLPYDLRIVLGHLSQKMKAYVYTKMCAGIFIAALFVIAPNWKPNLFEKWMWMFKQTLVHPDNGILFSTKNKWAIKPWKDMDES